MAGWKMDPEGRSIFYCRWGNLPACHVSFLECITLRKREKHTKKCYQIHKCPIFPWLKWMVKKLSGNSLWFFKRLVESEHLKRLSDLQRSLAPAIKLHPQFPHRIHRNWRFFPTLGVCQAREICVSIYRKVSKVVERPSEYWISTRQKTVDVGEF